MKAAPHQRWTVKEASYMSHVTLWTNHQGKRPHVWEQTRSEVSLGQIFKLQDFESFSIKRSKSAAVSTKRRWIISSTTEQKPRMEQQSRAPCTKGSYKFAWVRQGVKLTSSGGHNVQICGVKCLRWHCSGFFLQSSALFYRNACLTSDAPLN